MLEDTIGPRPKVDYDILREQQKLTKAANTLDYVGLGNIKDALEGGIDATRGKLMKGITGAGPIKEGRVYLNPANLGATDLNINENTPLNQRPPGYTLFGPSGRTPNDVLLQAAADAKQIEGYNKALPKVKQAIRSGFNTATDLTGSVPLFDPAFRQAIEQGNMGEAAKRVGAEYATGLIAAPVVGLGMGVLNRVSPKAAALATGALGTARVANPIAVVSQLGGSAKPTPAAAAAEQAAGKAQLLRAEAARKRGGKWNFPTPFGRLTIPELGLSEAGGLFFR
jgi:hypothetical protein